MLRVVVVLILAALVAVAVIWAPSVNLREISAWAEPHRYAWYSLPLVVITFSVLTMVPVVLLIAVTGLAFGPWLGPIYAMAGCLASASVGFFIGRWLGARRVEHLGGERIVRLIRTLRRNGTLAVFFVRKVPAPFLLANIVVGASTVAYRDFIVGTLLGMGALVVALAGFGYQLTRAFQDPSPSTWVAASLVVGIPLTLAWAINRAMRRTRPA